MCSSDLTEIIRVASEGYAPVEIDLQDLSIHEEEKNATAALIRGVAANFAQRGAKLQGFDAEVRSTVLPGSGLSSSAAFEVLIGTICNELFFGGKLTAVEIAQVGQWAENVYFGKPCGLMDQTASSVGGMVFIDFADPAHPVVEKLDFDFAKAGHALCIIDSGADHADLTDEYAAIPGEMKAVAQLLGREVLRDVPEAEFFAAIPQLRGRVPEPAGPGPGRGPAAERFRGVPAPDQGVRPQLLDVSAEHHPRRCHRPPGGGRDPGSVRQPAGRPGRLPGSRRRLCRDCPGLRAPGSVG